MRTIDISNPVPGTISLKDLSWDVRVRELLAVCTARQHYRNDSRQTLEIVYTFPLAWSSVVTRFAAEIGGERLVAQALEKKAAEDRYESALESGDAPMMLEVNESEGMCTANLGSLKPGEEAVLEIGTAWMAAMEQGGLVRIAIPTVIAERYSPDGSQGGLLPHQQVSSNFLAEYPCKARFTLEGCLAQGAVSCPSHTTRVSHGDGRTVVEVPCALADRDITLLVSQVSEAPRSLITRDGDAWAACSTIFCPQPVAEPRSGIGVKVLVDCSGSMTGASIRLAKSAIGSLEEILCEDDSLSLTLFGSGSRHVVRTLSPCTKSFWRRTWKPAVEAIDSNMGGTELGEALAKVMKIPGRGAGVLLITDGEVWHGDAIRQAVETGGERVFVIGVGLSPAENELRRIALASGGDCVFVMPSEDMRQTVARLIARMRSAPIDKARFAVEPEPLWMNREELRAFAGESLSVFAAYGERPEAAGTLLGVRGKETVEIQAAPWLEIDSRELAQLVAWERCKLERDPEARAQLALRYGLLTGQTNLILVKERAEGDKQSGMPVLEQVPQMVAAREMDFAGADAVCMDVSMDVSRSSGLPDRARGFRALRKFLAPAPRCGARCDEGMPAEPEEMDLRERLAAVLDSGCASLEAFGTRLAGILASGADEELAEALDRLEPQLDQETLAAVLVLWLDYSAAADGHQDLVDEARAFIIGRIELEMLEDLFEQLDLAV